VCPYNELQKQKATYENNQHGKKKKVQIRKKSIFPKEISSHPPSHLSSPFLYCSDLPCFRFQSLDRLSREFLLLAFLVELETIFLPTPFPFCTIDPFALIDDEAVFERFVKGVVGSAVREASFCDIVRSSKIEVDVVQEGDIGETT
jgi:hypothetical protein